MMRRMLKLMVGMLAVLIAVNLPVGPTSGQTEPSGMPLALYRGMDPEGMALYLTNPADGWSRRVTPLFGDIHYFGLSPDQAWVYYGGFDGTTYQLYRSHLRNETTETIGPVLPPAPIMMAPDQTWFAYYGQDGNQFFLLAAEPDGLGQRVLVSNPDDTHILNYTGLWISPDSQWVFFNTTTPDQQMDMWAIRRDGTGLVNLTADIASNVQVCDKQLPNHAIALVLVNGRLQFFDPRHGAFYQFDSATVLSGEWAMQNVITNGYCSYQLATMPFGEHSDDWKKAFEGRDDYSFGGQSLDGRWLQATRTYEVVDPPNGTIEYSETSAIRRDGTTSIELPMDSFLFGESPDGQWLIYLAIEDATFQFQIRRARPDVDEIIVTGRALSPVGWVGDWLLYSDIDANSVATLYRVRLDGTEPMALRQHNGYNNFPIYAIIWVNED